MNKANLHLNDYIKYLNKLDINKFVSNYKDTFYGKWNDFEVKILDKSFNKLFKCNFNYNPDINYSFLNNVKIVNDYITLNHFYWNVKILINDYAIIEYGNISLFVILDFIDIIEEKNYLNYTPSEVKNMLLLNDKNHSSVLPSNLNDITINDVKYKQKSIQNNIDDLKCEIENIKQNKNEELKKIQEEIDEKMRILNNRKSELMNELTSKMIEYNEKLNILKNQIYMLKSEIYSIRCFAGETIELIQLRNGIEENIEMPVVLNQKILYLDEDLAKVMSIYSNEIDENYSIIEEVLKYNDEVMNLFCPQSKSITFFKCSKNSNNIFYDKLKDILNSYKMLHGNKLGFIVRNGENLYIGWLEENWDNDTSDRDEHILSFNDSVIYKPDVKEYNMNDEINNYSDSIEHVVSRIFALSILQGLIENKHLIKLPENVNISIPSKYVIHNYADTWLEDNRYGDFGNLVFNLNMYNKVNDIILLITNLSESNAKPYFANRSIGDLNTTRDCIVKSGLNKINMIQNNNVYISAKKDNFYGLCNRKNNANFKISDNEFVNLTFMNSNWLKYYIDTKKIGKFGIYTNMYGSTQHLNYAYLIKYFKIAYEYLINREKDEKILISKYVENLDKYNWLDLLSHWKIYNDVRIINDYQAKRFANYLLKGTYFKIKHLFENKKEFTSLNLDSEFFSTNVSILRKHRYTCDIKYTKYGWHNDEFVDKKFTNDTSIDDIKEREKFDELKIKEIRTKVFNYANENNIDVLHDKYFIKQIKNMNKIENADKLVPNTINKIMNNIIKSECKYDDYKDIFIDDVKNSSYYWWNNNDKKLYKLMYILYLQDNVYPYICKCIENTIKYNYYHEIKRIDEYEKM